MTAQRARAAVAVPTVFCVIGSLPIFFTAAEAVALQRDLGFGPSLLGLGISLAFASSAIAVVPFARLVHRTGAARGFQLSTALTALALWTIASAGSWAIVATGLALGGAANACAQISANLALARRVVPGRQGVAFATKQAAGPLAGAIAGASVAASGPVAGWRALLLVVSVLALAVAVALPRVSAAADRQRTVTSAPRRRGVLLIAAAGLFGGTAGGALTTFTVDAAIATGLSQTAAGALLAGGSVAAVAGGLAAGRLADQRGSSGLTELSVLTGLGVLSLIVVSVAGDAPWLFVAGVLAAFATGWGWPGIIYYATVRTQRSTQATGIVLAWVYAGNVIGPTGAGLLIAHVSYPAAWRAGALSLALATLAALIARRVMGASPCVP